MIEEINFQQTLFRIVETEIGKDIAATRLNVLVCCGFSRLHCFDVCFHLSGYLRATALCPAFQPFWRPSSMTSIQSFKVRSSRSGLPRSGRSSF